ncbi:MAG: SUF system NifU family Fe-S cluster assembly protein [Bacilli bacterium]|nr:SUF system NifU family Fe-S cluster assembly protein [Bacilli bacterium]
MDSSTKREIILENYQNPTNKGLIEDETYQKANMNNESCIDDINLMVKIENNIIKDIRFDGEACAISTSSTSIMINTLIGKTVEEAKEIYKNFTNMIDEKEYNSDLLEEAIVYDDIYKQPSRKKCALLPWWALDKILGENNGK